MQDKRIQYTVNFTLSITKLCPSSYSSTTEVSTSVTESVPENVNPVEFLRKRLSEEFKRKTADLQLDLTTETEPVI